MKTIISYAQNREDVIIDALLGRPEKGVYVDVGAAHPDEDSVTKYFYEKGWSGVNIDANRKMIDLLTAARKRDINVWVGVGAKKGTMIQRQYLGAYGLSTFSEDMKQQNSEAKEAQAYFDAEIQIDRLDAILKENKIKGTIDFLKIDVEGLEADVIRGNDWKVYRPKVICIEANHRSEAWQGLLKKHEYKIVFYDGLNEYYVDEKWEGFDQRDFSRDYLDLAVGQTVITPELNNLVHDLKARAAQLQGLLLASHERIAELEQPVGVLGEFGRLLQSIENLFAKKAEETKRRKYRKNTTVYSVSDEADASEILVQIKATDMREKQPPREKLVWVLLSWVFHLSYLCAKFIRKAYEKAIERISRKRNGV